MTHSTKPPLWFWIVSTLMLLWNGVGAAAYIQEATLSQDALQAMNAEARALLLSRPPWATAAFAIAVFGGTIGCLLLLVRSRRAVPILMLSLLGVAVQMVHAFLIANSYAVFGPGGLIMPAMIVAGALFLVWFALFARGRGWLG